MLYKIAIDAEKPQHTVEIPYDYWLARFTVTNAQFGQFIKASGYKTTAEQQGSAYGYTGSLLDHHSIHPCLDNGWAARPPLRVH
ncbi:MAG: hypothetical protein Fur0016_06600 [Anaerolineales bacterium]